MGSTTCVRCGATAYSSDKFDNLNAADIGGYACDTCGLVWLYDKKEDWPQ